MVVLVDDDLIKRIRAAHEELSTKTLRSFGPNSINKHYLDDLHFQHPAAQRLVQAGKDLGDGANLMISIAGKHLEGAIELITNGLHPTEVINGYKKASCKLREILEGLVEEGSTTMDPTDKDQVILRMRAPISCRQFRNDILCPLIAAACIRVYTNNSSEFLVEKVRVGKLLGKDLLGSTTFTGMVLQADSVVGSIKTIPKPKVFVILALENVLSQQLENYANAKKQEQLIQEVARLGAHVIVSGAPGKMARSLCEQNKMMLLKIDSMAELDYLRLTTNAFDDLEFQGTPYSIGYADSINLEEIYGPRVSITYAKSCLSTVLLGTNEWGVVNPFEERAVSKGLYAYKALCKDSRIVPGAGATEIEIARKLKEYSLTETGSDKDAITKYANSFELIPKTLAENAYLNATNIISALYAEHNIGKVNVGIDLEEGACKDTSTLKIWDLYTIKDQALQEATLAVCEILHDYEVECDLSLAKEIFMEDFKQVAKRDYYIAVELEDIMQHDKRFTQKWLGIGKEENRFFALSQDGRLYCVGRSTKLNWCSNVCEALDLTDERIKGFFFEDTLKMTSMNSRTPDLEFRGDNVVFEETLGNEHDRRAKISRTEKRLFFHLETGDRVSAAKCPYDKVLCLTRFDDEVSFYTGKSQVWYTRECSFTLRIVDSKAVKFLHSKSKNPLYQICKRVEWRFSTEDLYINLPWKGLIMDEVGNTLVNVNVKHVTTVISLEQKAGIDTRAVSELMTSITDVSGTNKYLVEVLGWCALDGKVLVFINTSRMTLLSQLPFHTFKDEKISLRIIRGVLKGMKCYYEEQVMTGCLDIENVYVSSNFSVKRNFSVKISGVSAKTELPMKKMLRKASAKDEMEKLGAIAFYCLTGIIYNGSNGQHNPNQPNPLKLPPFLKRLSKDALDFLNTVLKGVVSIRDALSHNVFWTETKTLNFINAVMVAAEVGKIQGTLGRAIQSLNLNVLGATHPRRPNDGSWYSVFPEQFHVIMMEESYSTKTVIYNVYQVYDLLMIVRNLLTHEETIRKAIRKKPKDKELDAMFQGNIWEWVYETLRSKLPNLFNELWKVLKSHLQGNENFKNYY